MLAGMEVSRSPGGRVFQQAGVFRKSVHRRSDTHVRQGLTSAGAGHYPSFLIITSKECPGL